MSTPYSRQEMAAARSAGSRNFVSIAGLARATHARQVVTIVAAGALVAACSSSKSPQASSTASGSASSSAAATTSAAASSAAPSSVGGSSPAASSVAPASSGAPASDISASISISMQQTDLKTGDPTTYALVQAFEQKYPNIKVNLSGQPVAQHDQTIDVGAQSHTLPDIFWVQSATTGVKLAQSGALLDLAPILQSGGIADKIAPATLAEFKSGNTQFGVPYQALVTGFYYNKKILADNGLQLPTTFDQLVHVATVLHQKGITTISNGANQSAFSVWAFLTALDRYGYDARIPGILAGTGSYNNPDFLKFYQDLAQLQKAGAFSSNVSSETYNQAVAEFSAGKSAFLDSGVWAASQLQSSPVGPDVGFWIGPTFSDGVGPQNIAMNVVGAPLSASASLKPGTPKYEAVAAFFDFYYSDAGQQIFIANGQPPVTTLTPVVPADQTVFNAVLTAIHGVPAPKAQPDQFLSTASQNAMYDSMYGVIEGQLTPQAAITLADTAIKANK